jgi:single-strand DNA-binding protein
MQKLIILGNLGADPEMRVMPDGTYVTSFSMAESRRYTGKNGEKNEETIWFRVSAFGKLAEICNEFLEKGRKVLVEGRLTPDRDTGGPRIWTNRDGVPQAGYDVRALDVSFVDSASSEGSQREARETIFVDDRKNTAAGKQDPLAGF